MKKIMIIWICIMAMLQAVNIGDRLPSVILEKDNGGTSNNKPWHSISLKGKVHVLLYMDPDKREESQELLDALKRLKVNSKKYSTVAIVNLAATWIPNAVLEGLLSKKEKELKNTSFVFDKKKYLVKKWNMQDDISNVLIIDSTSKVIYKKVGKCLSKDVDIIVNKIKYLLK